MDTAAGPLANIIVLDLSRVLAGPYCTMVLADLGARVIKVETPGGGDDARHFGPFIGGQSAYFMSLNHGKESIALDLKEPEDRAVFEQLLAKADVVVENFRAGAFARLGYDWDALHARYPRLIYAAISGFGQTGPYRHRPAYDMVVQGMGGLMSVTGHPGGPPTRVGTSIGDISAGLFATAGIGAALYRREQTGEGMMIDVGMLDCQIAILENAIARFGASGEVPGPLGARHPSVSPFEAYATGDGYIIIAAGNDRLFQRLCAALELPEAAADPRFADNAKRCLHAETLKALIEERLKPRSTEHWVEALAQAGVPCGPINTVRDALNDPQVRHRNMVVTMNQPEAGQLAIAGNPIKTSAYRDSDTRGAAPALDGDRDAILALIGGRPSEDRNSSDPRAGGARGHETAETAENLKP